MLKKLFRPKWQHQNPEVRLQALADLDPLEPENQTIVVQLARGDSSEAVRTAAVGKLVDMKVLDDILQKDTTPTVKEAATEQLCRLLAGVAAGAPAEENLIRLIRLTENRQALQYVATESPSPHCREAAIGQLTDAAHLMALACHGKTEPERVLAAQRIHQEDLLRRLVREGRDKRVVRIAREVLKANQSARQQQTRQMAERQQLLQQLQTQSGRAMDPLYEARVQQLAQQWETLAADASDAEQAQATQWLGKCRQRIEQQATEAHQAQARQVAADELAAAVSSLQQALDSISAETWQASLGSLRAMLSTQQRRWEVAAETLPPPAELAEAFQKATALWVTLLGLVAEISDKRDSAEALTEIAGRWPAAVPAPADLACATAQTTVAPQPQPAEPHPKNGGNRLLGALRRELQQRNLRHANRLWTRLHEQPLDAATTAQLERLKPALEELRDWHRFAAEPKKQQLCEDMEALVQTNLPPAEKATAIQVLHDAWRALMSSDQDADQQLWERFKTASDHAYEPCREHFREQDQERRSNLQRRIALCEQLEKFVAALDPEKSDWPAVWEIRQRAPAEWRDYQPVRFTDARDTANRFSQLLKTLDTLLQDASNRHQAQREDIITALQQIAATDPLPADAIDHTRALQQQWNQSGWVMPRQHRSLQKNYRQLCDRIYAARDAARDQHKAELVRQRQAVAQLTDALLAALHKTTRELDPGAIHQLASELRAADLPGGDRKLQERRDAALEKARKLRQQLPRWQDWQSLMEKITRTADSPPSDDQLLLATRLEVISGTDSPASAQDLRRQIQIERLEKAMQGANPAPLTEIKRLLLEDHIGLLQQGLDPAIRQRFIAALTQLEPNMTL